MISDEFRDHDQQHETLSSVLQHAKDAETKAAELSKKARNIGLLLDELAPQVGKVHGSTSESIGTATSDGNF